MRSESTLELVREKHARLLELNAAQEVVKVLATGHTVYGHAEHFVSMLRASGPAARVEAANNMIPAMLSKRAGPNAWRVADPNVMEYVDTAGTLLNAMYEETWFHLISKIS